MTSASLRQIAEALGGDVVRGQVLAPGPGHSTGDRSLSVRLSSDSPEGFICHSFAGDDWRECREFVRERLGIRPRNLKHSQRQPHLRVVQPFRPRTEHCNDHLHAAIELWRSSIDPRGTLVETYLRSRTLDLDDDVAGKVLRWNPKIQAMVALFRNIETDLPQGVSRTYLDDDGNKIERRFLGSVGGAAIKLDADGDVLSGLHIGEGVETCLAARKLGLRPTWALGSCVAIGAFPLLSGVEYLSMTR